MGAVICIGCRSPLDECACTELEEAEVAESYLDGECHLCHQIVVDLYPQLEIGGYQTTYVCGECIDLQHRPPST